MRVKNHALSDITNENQCLKEKNDLSKNKLARLKEVNEQLKIECIQLKADNLDLQSEEESCSSDSDTISLNLPPLMLKQLFKRLSVTTNILQK